MPRRRRPGLSKATIFLEDLIDRLQARGGDRLPPVRSLGEQADVSLATMHAAVSAMCRAGALSARPGSGISIVPGGKPASSKLRIAGPETDAPLKWQRTLTAISADLSRGRFPPNRNLPSIKHLAEQYGTAARTMAKVLRELVRLNLAVQTSGGVRPAAGPRSFAPGAAVLLIGRGGTDGSLARWSPRETENLRTFERECSGNGLVPTELAWVAETDRFHLRDRGAVALKQLAQDRLLVGIIIRLMGLYDDHMQPMIDECAALGLPVAVFDEFGAPLRPGAPRGGGRVRVFASAHGTAEGHAAARHLLDLGHRRIAYLSHVHDSPWSQQRFEGVREVCDAVGATAVPVTTDAFGSEVSSHPWADRMHPRIRKLAGGMRRQKDPEAGAVLARILEKLDRRIGEELARESTRRLLGPLFEQALARDDITAWICAGDEIAVCALDFLQEKGISVPGRISVMGYDDTIEAFDRGITSYNFNGMAAFHAMMTHILSPRQTAVVQPGAAPLEIPGYVAARRTTGRN